MKFQLLLVSLSIFVSNISLTSAQNAQAPQSAVFSSVGNPYPAVDQPGISLDREIVYLRELDSMASWRFAYTFKNTSESVEQAVEMVTPVTVYFDDFRPARRSFLLKNLATVFPDLFQVVNSSKDTRPELQSKFGNRLFVKRFANQMDLARAGVAYSLQVNGENKAVSKIGIEFRWDSQPGRPPSLQMRIDFFHQLTVPAGGSTEIVARLKVPSSTRTEKPERYTVIEMGGPQSWNGKIGNVYLVNKLDGTRPLLSKGLQPDQKMTGRDGMATILRDLNTSGLRIGFYYEQPLSGSYYLPSGLGEIAATSSATISEDQPAKLSLERLSVTERIYDMELRHGLSNLYPSWTAYAFEGYHLAESMKHKSANGMAEAAFDRSATDDKSYLQTAWCENAEGNGKGQRINFRLLQSARGLFLENGDQSSEENYLKNGRLRSVRLKSSGMDELLAVNDIKVLNAYEFEMPAGDYSLELNTVFPGKSGKTCLSAVFFDYKIGEQWFDLKFPQL